MKPTQETVRELLRRARCRESLHSFALNVKIPTSPIEPIYPDEELLGPARLHMATHHAVMLDTIQRTMDKPFGRAMIFAPPGSAKSLYTSVLAGTWEMSRKPGSRVILASYAADIAERQSRRCHSIVDQDDYRAIFPEARLGRDAAGDWTLEFESGCDASEYLARGFKSGITGNRANGIIIDDPLSGREDADSEPIRKKVLAGYIDDIQSRLLPGAWIILVMTRWHEDDLAGNILPETYKGESGTIIGNDGLEWEVLNIPAKAEHKDDPIGRQVGEYLWPEWFPAKHWSVYEKGKGRDAARAWASLYQQRPTTKGDGRFHESMIDYYQPGAQPPHLIYVGAGDYAVTVGGGDFTELGVFGVDPQGDLWEVAWWSKQCNTGESCEETLNLIKRHKVNMWFNEGGLIDKAMGPLFNIRMRQRKVYADRRSIPSMSDKLAKAASFQALCAAGGERGDDTFYTGKVHFRDNANSRRVVQQLISLPSGRYDDAADVCGLIGRAIDQFPMCKQPRQPDRPKLKPFSAAWLEYQENIKAQERVC